MCFLSPVRRRGLPYVVCGLVGGVPSPECPPPRWPRASSARAAVFGLWSSWSHRGRRLGAATGAPARASLPTRPVGRVQTRCSDPARAAAATTPKRKACSSTGCNCISQLLFILVYLSRALISTASLQPVLQRLKRARALLHRSDEASCSHPRPSGGLRPRSCGRCTRGASASSWAPSAG